MEIVPIAKVRDIQTRYTTSESRTRSTIEFNLQQIRFNLMKYYNRPLPFLWVANKLTN